jgi:FtsZ-binding cell division protein ZapB
MSYGTFPESARNKLFETCKAYLDDAEADLAEHNYDDASISLRMAKGDVDMLKDLHLTSRYKNLSARLVKESLLHKTDTDRSIQTEKTSLDRLLAAKQQLIETEEVAVMTLTDLKKQGEQLKKTKDNLQTVDEELSVSQKILRNMSRWWRG